jgi:GTPase SAR1 family protein
MPRSAKCTLVLGFNGTGKTTYLRSLLEHMLQNANDNNQRLKILIVTPDDTEWQDYPENNLDTPDDYVFNGIQRHVWQEQYADIKHYSLQRIALFNNGIIVFDDCKVYFGDNLPQEIINLFVRRRQRSLDVFFVGHGFTTIPPRAFTYYSDAILFRTVDNIDRRKNCISNFDYFKKQQAFVNHRAQKDPHYHIHIANDQV